MSTKAVDKIFSELDTETIILTSNDCQKLMDDLWKYNFRPTGFNESATQAHLNDMRAIVAEKLKVKL